jgi:hypothetical protein
MCKESKRAKKNHNKFIMKKIYQETTTFGVICFTKPKSHDLVILTPFPKS